MPGQRFIDARRLAGRIPGDRSGDKDLEILAGGKSIQRRERAFRHLGPRKVDSSLPWKRILQFSQGRPEAVFHHAGKPGDPTRPMSNWWMSGGNLYHDGNGRITSNMSPQLQWERSSPQGLVQTEPVVSGDVVVVAPWGNGSEKLLALDRTTGNVLWKWESDTLDPTIDSSPVAVNHRLMLAELRPSGDVYLDCVDSATGSILWDALVMESASDSYVRIAAAYGLIYLLTVGGSLRAFDAETGELCWERLNEVPFSPNIGSDEALTVAYGSLIVGSSNGLRAYNPASGGAEWFSPVVFDCSFSAPMAMTGGNPPLIVAGDNFGMLYAFNAFTSELVWSQQLEDTFWWPEMACDRHRLIVRQNATVLALDPANGDVLAQSPVLGGFTNAAPTLVGNRVFQLTSSLSDPSQAYQLVSLTLPDLAIAEQVEIESPDVARPVVEGPHLFINVWSSDAAGQTAATVRNYRIVTN